MEKPVRILQVFGRMDRGGAETFLMNLYRNINRDKIQFDFAVHTDTKGQYDDEILKLGGRIFHLPRYKVYNHIQYKNEWKKLLKKYKFKAVHGHMHSTASIYLKLAKYHGITTVIHSHSTSSVGNQLKLKLVDKLHKNLNNVSDYKLACSTEAGEYLYGKNQNFKIIKNGINIKDFTFDENFRKKMRYNLNIKDQLVIGHVGNYSYPKNHSFIVNLFERICRKNEDSILILVGKGVKEGIYELVKEKQLENKILFLGSRDNVNELLQAFDVFILPSIHEGLPVTAIEAQASGLKCFLSSNISKECKVTNNICFLPVGKSNSIELWAKNILECNDYERKNEISNIRKNGYDIKEIANYMNDFYFSII